ncbi:hypothetical protein [Herbaspirillum huttiense]|uniref:Uncharacterized protein n=2 Tax=Herbaspirillum huttiense TaxID=863372 RepID=A0AAJ2HD67_9BURK|nr:hypothetical protein [Herbaspirillum huttiense]MDR9839189.1 hypothetical protein [Herbaspirillum huttiense]
MMHLARHCAAVFKPANSQSYGDLPPLLGTKLGGTGSSMVLPPQDLLWQASAVRKQMRSRHRLRKCSPGHAPACGHDPHQLGENAPKQRTRLALLHCSASYADWTAENTYFCFAARSKRNKSQVSLCCNPSHAVNRNPASKQPPAQAQQVMRPLF